MNRILPDNISNVDILLLPEELTQLVDLVKLLSAHKVYPEEIVSVIYLHQAQLVYIQDEIAVLLK